MMTAILEVDFDPNVMYVRKWAIKEHGSYLKAMQWLFEQDSIGIFSGDIRLVAIKEKPTQTVQVHDEEDKTKLVDLKP